MRFLSNLLRRKSAAASLVLCGVPSSTRCAPRVPLGLPVPPVERVSPCHHGTSAPCATRLRRDYPLLTGSALRSIGGTTMASADFWQSFPTPLDVSSTQADRQISPGIAHSPSAYARRIYVTVFRASIGLCIYWPAYPTAPPLSASCSSGQPFAYSFLQIPPRDGHPCRSANTSPCRV